MADCEDGDCNDPLYEGFALSVYDNADDCCTRRLLKPDGMAANGLPIVGADSRVAIKDGSFANPIILPAIAEYAGPNVPALLIQMPNGMIAKWTAASLGCNKKIIVQNGMWAVVDDFAIDLYQGNICAASCAQVTSALGVKEVTVSCPGQDDRTVWQLCRIPTCCCAESPAEICESCESLEEFRNTDPVET